MMRPISCVQIGLAKFTRIPIVQASVDSFMCSVTAARSPFSLAPLSFIPSRVHGEHSQSQIPTYVHSVRIEESKSSVPRSRVHFPKIRVQFASAFLSLDLPDQLYSRNILVDNLLSVQREIDEHADSLQILQNFDVSILSLVLLLLLLLLRLC